MISGFNTDIEFDGTVYHVQTEDKGYSARMIMSLVYDGGTILASKRVSYDDLKVTNFDERELSDRVSRQHKLLCAAVSAGRIDELKEMTAKSAANGKPKAEKAAVLETVGVSAPIPIPQAEIVHEHDIVMADLFATETVIEEVDVIEDEEILPAEAVQAISELSGRERASNTKLSLEMLGETKFKGGDRHTVTLMICRGTERKVVPDAQIMIKVLGSSFRPVIFHAKTDSNGLASVHLQLPHFQTGRAALLVRVMTDGEEIELRRIVNPG